MRRDAPRNTVKKGSKGTITMKLFYTHMESPVGKLKLVASSNALVAVLWEQERPNRVKLDSAIVRSQASDPARGRATVDGIFFDQTNRFDLPLEPNGSNSKRKSGSALREIPFGQTRSYLDLAKAIGSSTAAARSAPPMAKIRYPSSCRVIGSSARTDRSPALPAAFRPKQRC